MATKDKSVGDKLKEKLFTKSRNIGDEQNDILDKASKFCEGYKDFLNYKTEREVVDYVVPMIKKKGYKEFEAGKKYKAGTKLYLNLRGKDIIMVTIGKKSLSEGMRIAVSHIDSPRLDFKPNPLFESDDMSFFKTHYYGGIKNYQWATIPLSIHGEVVLKDGKKVKVTIGEEEGDPVFCVSDLLVHLAREQMKKSANDVITGEQLNVLIGSWPFKDKDVSARVKLNTLKLLNDKYGITEEDFITAELCVVPAYKPVDVGIDRSMIGAYGQDDSSCAYATLMAEIECKSPEYTTVTALGDKEETGSDGPTGFASTFLMDFINDLVEPYGFELRSVLAKSFCISADVTSAFDPAFGENFEKNNACFLNHGIAVHKYGGAWGKYGTIDASAEVMHFVRKVLDDNNIIWQTGELGKIDNGGGGTVSRYIAKYNVDAIDIGVPVLSMHAPFEITAKADMYMLYLAMKALYETKLTVRY